MENPSPQHLWGSRPLNIREYVEAPPTISTMTMNNLGSIENNNCVQEKTMKSKNFLPRQKSFNTIERELLSLSNQIREKLDAVEMAKKLENAKQVDFGNTSDTERNDFGSSKKKQNSLNKSGIYATYVQDGDNNLMVVCEPTGSMKTKYCRQIGNNNVMVNVSMVNNKCQIIDLNGKVFQIDSDGVYWLEIRKRHRDSGVFSTSPGASPDLNSPDDWPNTETPPLPRQAFIGQRNVDHAEDNIYYDLTQLGKHRMAPLPTATSVYTDSRLPRLNPDRTPVEHYDSSETIFANDTTSKESEIYTNFDIEEEDDVIKIKMEPPPGCQKFSRYTSLEDCAAVRTALDHRTVKEFLQRQEEQFDVDVSIIGWEYEKEEIYSTVPNENRSLDENEDVYSTTIQLIRKPTLPPRPNLQPQQNEATIDDTEEEKGNYDSIDDMKVQLVPPVLPPRLYYDHSEPCEQSYYSTTAAASPLDDDKTNNGNVTSLPPRIETIVPSSPPTQKKTLPPPPRKPIAAPRLPRKTTGQFKDSYEDVPWYHGQISSGEAKARLKGKPDGSFLVRDTTGEHKFTLEVVEAGDSRRLKIWQTNNKYHLEKTVESNSDKEFNSLVELIEAAMKAGIEVQDGRSTERWKIVKIIPVGKQ